MPDIAVVQQIVVDTRPVVQQVVVAPIAVVQAVQLAGIPGPKGDPGSGAVFEQPTPLATWSFNHSLGRIPAVAISIAGEQVLAPVTATPTQVVVTFPSPQSGFLILS